eukprot:NODE_3401_length_933_cov_9.473982_g2833_i0.p1 GENE.NODE_3401_length_933_cov_9.473982_g2833_i0~~NODE_3401_length_933_cov_9.473982_g2833_i0.p1  ORF type:complete len:193 (-),score=5.45 NODE_3401_length_933_cov_9.473982_g2833_i0:212-790(-)
MRSGFLLSHPCLFVVFCAVFLLARASEYQDNELHEAPSLSVSQNYTPSVTSCRSFIRCDTCSSVPGCKWCFHQVKCFSEHDPGFPSACPDIPCILVDPDNSETIAIWIGVGLVFILVILCLLFGCMFGCKGRKRRAEPPDFVVPADCLLTVSTPVCFDVFRMRTWSLKARVTFSTDLRLLRLARMVAFSAPR